MEAETTSITLMEYFRLGGIAMWPLLLYSVATIAIVLERTIHFIQNNMRMDDLEDEVRKRIRNNDIPGAKQYLETKTKKRVGARILIAMINQSHLSEHRMEKAVEVEASTCINSLENGFNFLTALGSISPLTGFLGTVTGMIGAFRSIAEASEVNAQIVANGIYEALITTVFGLVIAIIAMVAHSILTHIVDRFAGEAERICSDLIIELAIRDKNENHQTEKG